MKMIVSHPTGNQNVRAAVKGFLEAGISTSFETTIATFPGGIMSGLSNVRQLSWLKRRCFDPSMKPVTHTWPWMEAGRLLAMKGGMRRLTKHEHGVLSIDAVYRNLDRRVANSLGWAARKGTSLIYAYEDGALNSFRKAKNTGIECYYDLPIGYWRAGQKIFAEQKELWPEWSSTLKALQDSQEKLLHKDEELELADRIYTASSFTAKTLLDFPGVLSNIEVVPYGFPPVAKVRSYPGAHYQTPLKVLFVGGLSQRKGIANLFAAVDGLKPHISLTLVGQRPLTRCQVLDKALARHKWIQNLPHDDILLLMQQHDVLLFPSLFEGFGLVITEAMSQGTPVITTDRTVGPDFIEHGRNGWLIEAGSVRAIKDSLEHLLCNRKCIEEVGHAAMETASKRPWEVYGRELAESVLRGYMSKEKFYASDAARH